MCFSFTFILFRGQAILIRQKEDDAVAGLFSQIGELYVVHHIWGEFMEDYLQNVIDYCIFHKS